MKERFLPTAMKNCNFIIQSKGISSVKGLISDLCLLINDLRRAMPSVYLFFVNNYAGTVLLESKIEFSVEKNKKMKSIRQQPAEVTWDRW